MFKDSNDGRTNYCSACAAIANGVKSRVALTHTCGKESNAKRPRRNRNIGIAAESEYLDSLRESVPANNRQTKPFTIPNKK